MGALLHSLLPSLAGRFTAVRDLDSGGESDVILARDDAGEVWVVKQYRQLGWAPDPDVLDVLADRRVGLTRSSWGQDRNARHVVWLQEWGVDPATGLFFEVQEYLEGGALAGADKARGSWSRLGQWPVDVFAEAVVEAVAGFHATVGGAHRDVKPQNLLVRSVDPLVLVLGDVGLSRQVGSGSVRFSERDGSAAYQAPEAAAWGKVSRAGDWWSVGVIIAETALGRHPLALPDGSLPDNRVMQTEMVERPMPLAGISDPRLRLLCEGLLTRDSQVRWGLPQIAQWQAGGSPATGFADAAPEGTGSRVRRVRFGGADYNTPTGLAAAFAADPDRAARGLFLDRDPVLDSQLRLMLEAHGLSEALSVLDGYRSGAWQPVFLRLLAEMDAGLSPELAGQSMTPDAVGQVAQQVIAAGQASAEQVQVLQWVIEHHVWRWWWELPGMGDAAQAAEALASQGAQSALARAGMRQNGLGRSDRLSLDNQGRAVWTDGAQADIHIYGLRELLAGSTVSRFWAMGKPVGDAFRVLLAVDASAAERAVKDVVGAASKTIRDQGWWDELAQSAVPIDRAVAAVSAGLAQQASESMKQQLELKRQQDARQAAEEAEANARHVREDRQAERRRQLVEAAAPRQQILRRKANRLRGSQDMGTTGGCSIALGLLILFWLLIVIPSYWLATDDLLTGLSFVFGGAALVLLPALALNWRRRRLQEVEAELARPLPFADPRYMWSDKEGDWVRT